MSSLRRFRRAAGAVILFTTMTTACASPTSPSKPVSETADTARPAPVPAAPMSAVTLTVRVLRRTVETPLPGALVQLGKQTVHADAGGVCQFTLQPGDTADVDVSAPGYEPLGASGVLNNDQRWTFYLEPVSAT